MKARSFMISYGLGDLYQKLKEMEKQLHELEHRVVEYTINNEAPVKEVADALIANYRNFKEEYDNWMTKVFYEEGE
ncbi:hypothetical protein D1872_264570 [compost metagenome]